MDRLAYFDPAKSLEEKEKGNDLFKKGRISSFFEKKMIHFVWHGLICEISSSLASKVSFEEDMDVKLLLLCMPVFGICWEGAEQVFIRKFWYMLGVE